MWKGRLDTSDESGWQQGKLNPGSKCRKRLIGHTLPKDILPKDILPNGHFADGHFAERTLCRTDVLPNGHFAERTVFRTDNLPKIEMLFHQNVWDCDSFFNCVILNHSVK
jgi:hypothetical protein